MRAIRRTLDEQYQLIMECCGHMDMRKSIDRLCAIIETSWTWNPAMQIHSISPAGGDVTVIKALLHEPTGFDDYEGRGCGSGGKDATGLSGEQVDYEYVDKGTG